MTLRQLTLACVWAMLNSGAIWLIGKEPGVAFGVFIGTLIGSIQMAVVI